MSIGVGGGRSSCGNARSASANVGQCRVSWLPVWLPPKRLAGLVRRGVDHLSLRQMTQFRSRRADNGGAAEVGGSGPGPRREPVALQLPTGREQSEFPTPPLQGRSATGLKRSVRPQMSCRSGRISVALDSGVGISDTRCREDGHRLGGAATTAHGLSFSGGYRSDGHRSLHGDDKDRRPAPE